MENFLQEAEDLYNRLEGVLHAGEEKFSLQDGQTLSDWLEKLEEAIVRCQRMKFRLGRLLDYDGLKGDGFSLDEIVGFEQEDRAYLEQVDGYYKNNLVKREYMFGYPANLEEYSYATQYLRWVESKMYLMNNCGDPYQNGNYGMDSKDIEQKIVSAFAKNYALEEGKYWGYITSGGTESNFWGVREGFQRFPKGKLYFSSDAHYSVEKFVSAGENAPMYPYEIIPCNARGEMDPDALKAAILRNAEQGVVGTVLVLTWGTTVRGAIDDVKGLTGWLKEQGLPYYCHLDAAHYGGIAANQQDSPALRDVVGLGIDSLSVSLHKFLGTARVNGVLLAIERTNRRVVEYIGQEDSTLLGSRDYLPFSTYQRVREMLWRKETNHYAENVRFFEDLLLRKGVSYQKHGRGNTFVVDKPREEVCKKYQLATFTDGDGKEYAHVIIFPFHQKGVMTGLVEELKGERHD